MWRFVLPLFVIVAVVVLLLAPVPFFGTRTCFVVIVPSILVARLTYSLVSWLSAVLAVIVGGVRQRSREEEGVLLRRKRFGMSTFYFHPQAMMDRSIEKPATNECRRIENEMP
jgi:hypothetical protein